MSVNVAKELASLSLKEFGFRQPIVVDADGVIICGHADLSIRRRRFWAAAKATAALLKSGTDVYSPIVHSTPIAACGLDDMDHEFWMRIDRPYLEWCTMVMVLTLDGWEQSRGVNMELAAARKTRTAFVWPTRACGSRKRALTS